MEFVKITLLSILAAVLYGILHDQVTARICVEYFTIGHMRLIDSHDPTVLGLFWGVVATWWVGLPLGIGLAIAARAGKSPKLEAVELIPGLIKLMVVMFVTASLAGGIGFITANESICRLAAPIARRVPPDKHAAFLTCGWAHSASYLSGLVGGLALWVLTWRRRRSETSGGTTERHDGA